MNNLAKIDKTMVVGDILRVDPSIADILMDNFMHCIGCPSSQMESLEDACAVHGIDADPIVEKINAYLAAN